jgi:hypothetical protein
MTLIGACRDPAEPIGRAFGSRISEDSAMLVRLGQVLYWLGCGAGAIIAIGLPVLLLTSGRGDAVANLPFIGTVGVLVGALCWLVGRAALYILSGK